jgi:hypothetical protein
LYSLPYLLRRYCRKVCGCSALPVTAAISSSPEAYREPRAWMCSFSHA